MKNQKGEFDNDEDLKREFDNKDAMKQLFMSNGEDEVYATFMTEKVDLDQYGEMKNLMSLGVTPDVAFMAVTRLTTRQIIYMVSKIKYHGGSDAYLLARTF